MVKKRLNHLTGAEWVQWSKSVWRFKEPVKENYGHPAIFPEILTERVIRAFTKQGDHILDPMVGTGTTNFVAKGLNRNCTGIEISDNWVKVAKQRLKNDSYQSKTIPEELNNSTESTNKTTESLSYKSPNLICEIHNDDACNLLKYVEPKTIDLCFTSPPYWTGLHGINGKYTGQTQKVVKQYSKLKKDLGNIEDYETFFSHLKEIYTAIYKALKPMKYSVTIIQDTRRGRNVIPIHIDFYKMMIELGFDYQDLIIWEHPTYTTRPLGYPTTFVISRVHDFLMVFRKKEAI